MRKLWNLFLVLVLIFSLAGCGVKQKIENKVGEKVAEKIIESATGDKNTKVDLDGDKVTIKDKDGNELILGGTEWPQNELVKNIPEFKEGNIISVAQESQGAVMIMLEKVEKSDFENYWEDVKKGFTENTFEMNSGELFSFAGENEQGVNVQLTYDSNNKGLTIVIVKDTDK